MIIKAIVHNAEEGGFWAEVPALPGCLTQGETREEIRENLLEAIEVWFEAGDVDTDEKESQIMELAIWSRYQEKNWRAPSKARVGFWPASRVATTSLRKTAGEKELSFPFMGIDL